MSHNMMLMEQTSRMELKQPKDVNSKGQRGQARCLTLVSTTEPKLLEVLDKLKYQEKTTTSEEVELV